MFTFDFQGRSIGLALSGGGVRAAAFHAGVLRWLAERNALEHVVHVSTVSGGSLFVGLVFHFSDYSWPASDQYISAVSPRIREILTRKSLQLDSIMRMIVNPLNWRHALSRANIIAASIEKLWGISATLDQLPAKPLWSINGTTAETGRRFRFKGFKIGDYEIGYAEANVFKLAAALAVSAAFPGGIGPLRIKTDRFKWYKRRTWNSVEPAEHWEPPFDALHLYDGGVYDNLGLEPLFNVGRQSGKDEDDNPVDLIIVSDAGAPFLRHQPFRSSNEARAIFFTVWGSLEQIYYVDSL